MYSKLKFKGICTFSDIRQVSVTTFVQFLKIIQNIPILIYVLRLYYVARLLVNASRANELFGPSIRRSPQLKINLTKIIQRNVYKFSDTGKMTLRTWPKKSKNLTLTPAILKTI